MLRVVGPGRAEVERGPAPDEVALAAALDAAFRDGTATSVGWWVPVGDWAARRTAWRLGFSYAGVLRGWADGGDAWAFTLRHDDVLLGAVGIFRFDDPELGYWTHPDARGRRLTTRAGALVVDHAFDTLGLARLSAYAATGNAASLRVLESLGMRRTGVQRRAARTGDGRTVDLVGYDLLPEERSSLRRWAAADHSSTAIPATESSAPTRAGAR
ncbi:MULTISPECIES: GNAT family N-acetyltransferase [unclassified Nocardioides]|uniref:GNAT family N-acetyltransferase n=1 Tax=unclassified Nocardioides TaxID=2615069 RepID=UPI0036181DAF